MNKDQSHLDGFMWAFLAFIGFTIISDLVGRLCRRLSYEWPYISLGLLVLFICLVVGWVYSRFQMAFETQSKEMSAKLEHIKSVEYSVDYKLKSLQEDVKSLRSEVSSHRSLCYDFIRKIETAAEQKTPVISVQTKVPDSTVQQAAKEITGDKS